MYETKSLQQVVSEIERDLAREREERRRGQEIDRRCKEILRPYAVAGRSFGEVQALEHCPGTLGKLYADLLQETAAERAKAARQQEKPGTTEAEEDPFLKGFLSDPYS